MKIKYILFFLPLFLIKIAIAAEMYRWVDADGKVHYTDTSPPLSAENIQKKKLGNKAGDAQMSYSLQQAVKNFPVILYNSKCGEPCSNATELLVERGIPFSSKIPEKNEKDAESLKKITNGELAVPVLVIGKDILKGFERNSWNNTLDLAGYPKSSYLIPKSSNKSNPVEE